MQASGSPTVQAVQSPWTSSSGQTASTSASLCSSSRCSSSMSSAINSAGMTVTACLPDAFVVLRPRSPLYAFRHRRARADSSERGLRPVAAKRAGPAPGDRAAMLLSCQGRAACRRFARRPAVTNNDDNDGRLDFSAAVARFGDDDETAEGARVFVVFRGAADEVRLRFVAGPFFSAAFAVNDEIAAAEAPDGVRSLRFLPTRCEEAWFTEQVQVLIQRLVDAAGITAPQMPDYLRAAGRGAGAEAVFPIAFIGRPH